MLPSTRSLAAIAALALVACSSSNFDVASGGGDSGPGGDTSQGGDSTGADTTIDDTAVDDTGKPRDTSVLDVPAPDGPSDAIGTGDAVGGDATPSCPVGTACTSTGGTACVDLKTDPKNCGACGTAVCHGEMCVAGAPTCVPGYGACPAGGTGSCLGCKDFASDILNCGSCGNKCTTGEYCNGGACKLVATFGGCGTGTSRCGPDAGPAGCVDLLNDRDNCGSCGNVCAPDEYCAGATCVQYRSAPGCTACPCSSCVSKFGKCCPYGPDTICSESSCPAG